MISHALLHAPVLQPYDPPLVGRLLNHLGFDRPLGRPSVESLRLLHRAFLDTVPYENLDIQLGRRSTIDPFESARRILAGRGGYCYHLNGVFATLLESLTYPVTLVRGAALRGGTPGVWGEHMAILVDFRHETYLADVGFGDGPRDPMPLVEGPVEQGPFGYRLEHLGGLFWRWHHDERGSVPGFDFDVRPVGFSDFEGQHRRQATAADSPYVAKLIVQRRGADHALTLRSCLLTRVDAGGRHVSEVETESAWTEVLAGEFGLNLDDLDADERTELWRRNREGYEAWVRAGRP